ncbi:peptidase S8 and S53 [Fusarium albosuccineum]|uniref:Peptidase S8 and S53 n=1 Tax=Fusarium albosuccineum TaxID=1237068 RepID=A0A8H4KYC2_9HYPO|nr:peptidase S8 and S53 [Fusarium albosuccineum]
MSGTNHGNEGGEGVDGTVITINGHTVELLSAEQAYNSRDDLGAHNTKWIIVKFSEFVDYELKRELRDQRDLHVHEHLGYNTYLCKRERDRNPASLFAGGMTHLNIYPSYAVPMADIMVPTSEGRQAATEADARRTESRGTDYKMAFEIALHPDPDQDLQSVADLIRDDFRGEHLDDEVVGNTIRVKFYSADIANVSKIDSIRTIATIPERSTFSVRQRTIMQFPAGTNGAYRGNGEVIFVADTGFDKGLVNNVHPAFTGRVLAATTAEYSTDAADQNGHGTHVAGAALASPNQPPQNAMSNLQGTAPEAKLISISMVFGNPLRFPRTYGLLTQHIPSFGRPIIMNNSWGSCFRKSNSEWTQVPYGIGHADAIDRVMHENSDVCLVFAAGNDGGCVNNTGPRMGLQQQIGGEAAAKNCITVGASHSDRPLGPHGIKYQDGGRVHDSKEMTFFSSTGPTFEGRLKPDVVAPGEVILSARSRAILPQREAKCLAQFGNPAENDLLFMTGTSQATPAVTGCVAVLRGAFRAEQHHTPSGALLKALIVHGAVDLVGTGFTVVKCADPERPQVVTRQNYIMTAAPNPFQGYGLVNINNSLRPIVGPIEDQHGFLEGNISSGRNQVIRSLTIPENAQRLVITLAYTDPPGNALQNRISLGLRLPDIRIATPLTPTDPMGRAIDYSPSNVAKIVQDAPPAGIYYILLTVETLESATYAVVWTFE